MKIEIAITGISGRFPESDNVSEWSQNLYNKRNLVTESSNRWEPGLHGLPRKLGQLKDLSKFDNEFFDVSEEQANLLDPQARILLESTYEAIVDAGNYNFKRCNLLAIHIKYLKRDSKFTSKTVESFELKVKIPLN
ncbi:fatty acid synthase [Nephila pilipes]|uniref:Fatty acid synthase n=1 Tax=Nephila pilipes TaxID=299642 RepID=A0A8X6TWX6_NEPPI|nr:fatty acid synthase [Nephila pilipes]